ncbi:PREDICTED: uncharacterized protein LOC108362513 [Rhagoletis zephyria]|uniref:uncharacterized protein LOC108362513 n=1 Tax=Rhagoletis zephyria TaxID=28612 RepID=UPI0008116A73|nr:PREDICTED: uncharacterized protein LOC108362513 [Rhagoletis zephyria]
MAHRNNGAIASLIFYLWLLFSLQISAVRPAIHSRASSVTSSNSNAIDESNVEIEDTDSVATNEAKIKKHQQQHRHQKPAEFVRRDFSEKMSWKCANNASCLHTLANDMLQAYKRGETISLGFMDLAKLPPLMEKDRDKLNAAETGRGISSFVDFISGNAIRIPVGPMVFSVQRAEDDGNYIEIALLKKASGNQGSFVFALDELMESYPVLLSMMYQFPEHTPYMMPYSMDYGIHPEMASGGEMYPAALQLAAAPMQHHGESLAAESNLHHNIADIQNNTQVLAALNAVHLGPKVKREDSWLGKVGGRKPLRYVNSPFKRKFHRNPYFEYFMLDKSWRRRSEEEVAIKVALAAAAAATEEEEQEEAELGDDDIFNHEESIKDTFEFLGMQLRRKKRQRHL